MNNPNPKDHLKVVFVSTATSERPAGAERPGLNPNDRASEPFAAMYSAADALRRCALDEKAMGWLPGWKPLPRRSTRIREKGASAARAKAGKRAGKAAKKKQAVGVEDGDASLLVGEWDVCRRLTKMACHGDGDVNVCAYEIIPFKRTSTMRHCVVPLRAGEGGSAKYYLWCEGTFSFPLGSA